MYKNRKGSGGGLATLPRLATLEMLAMLEMLATPLTVDGDVVKLLIEGKL